MPVRLAVGLRLSLSTHTVNASTAQHIVVGPLVCEDGPIKGVVMGVT